MGIAGCLLIATIGELDLRHTSAALAVLAAGLFVGHRLMAHHAAAIAAQRQSLDRQNAAKASLAQLCRASAPVWQRQIESGRDHGNGEVAQLTRVFGDLSMRLENVTGHLPRVSGDGDLAADLELAGAELQRLVGALGTLQESKERVVAEIGKQAQCLKENATEIRQIALHTRVVAMNATIEAARAGAAGKPFGVVVTDLRELVGRTAAASETFSRHTDRLHAMVTAAFDDQTHHEATDGSIAWAQDLVLRVTARFELVVKQLARSVEEMGAERLQLRDEISLVLTSLQFQDRVSQILTHVCHNLEQLERELESRSVEAVDTRAWIERMTTSYSTAEEFDNLHAAARRRAPAPAEVTYF